MSNKALTSATVCYVINIPIETAGGLDTYTKLQNLRLPIEYAPVASTGCVGVPVLKKTSTATGVYALPMIGIKTGCDLSAPTSDFTRNPIILERIFAFLIENGLFKEYKQYMLSIFAKFMYGVIGTPNKREYIIQAADRILTQIDFPNAFKDLEKPKFVFWKN
jgi:hypothetical protein